MALALTALEAATARIEVAADAVINLINTGAAADQAAVDALAGRVDAKAVALEAVVPPPTP